MTTTYFSLIALAAYFLLLVIFSALRFGDISGRAFYLLRALFPSWRFFEDLCEVPVLYYRFAAVGDPLGQWQPGFLPLKRSWSALLLNAQGNLQHACNSLLHQVENDLQLVDETNPQQFTTSVSYQLADKLVRYRILQVSGKQNSYHYQFKIVSEMQGGQELPAVEILVSAAAEV